MYTQPNPLFFLNARMGSYKQSKKAMHAVNFDAHAYYWWISNVVFFWTKNHKKNIKSTKKVENCKLNFLTSFQGCAAPKAGQNTQHYTSRPNIYLKRLSCAFTKNIFFFFLIFRTALRARLKCPNCNNSKCRV